MRIRRMGWRYGLVGAGVLVALALATSPALFGSLFHRRHTLDDVATAEVKRTDLSLSLTTGGQVDSTNRTTIECRLEALDVGVKGVRMTAGGSSTILSVIPDGSVVKEGDVLCVLDSSAYEELRITQQMNVERVRADHRQAELILEVAKTAVTEYREGLLQQNIKTMEGQIALSQSDHERAVDRLGWTRRMISKGYVPRSQLSQEELQANRLAFDLRKNKTRLKMFKEFYAPIYLKILESDIKLAESFLVYQDLRLKRTEERLEYLDRQIARCTIKAPHDGFVIYANEENKSIHIEPGMQVRQRQRLFYLPDLSSMEVAAVLHESVVKEVKPGMRAKVWIDALSGRELEGHVTAISPLPYNPQPWFSELKYFSATVKLDTLPKGLKPGMTAEVAIQTLRRPDVLAVPSEAVTIVDGHDYCLVAREDHVERREVKVGQATRDKLEVTDGLGEGEAVVMDPAHLDSSVEVVEVPAHLAASGNHPAHLESGSSTDPATD